MTAHPVRPQPTKFAQRLFAGLPDHYDRLAAILSLGQDRRWRREMIDHIAHALPATVLDVATGPAGVALQLADRTNATITGIDLSDDMLSRGRRNVIAAQREDRIQLVRGQGEQLPFPDCSFDALTFTYLLRYVANPAATIGELARVVRPGGTMASLEFAVPSRSRAGRSGVVRRRPLPRTQHHGSLPSLHGRRHHLRVAGCRIHQRRNATDEPRRRARRVGSTTRGDD